MVAVTIRSYVMLPNAPPDFRLGRPFELQVDEQTTLARLTDIVLSIPPGEVALVAVDGSLAELDYVIGEQDRVDLFPPIMGG
jgi:molybdopterin converting factor small subunit